MSYNKKRRDLSRQLSDNSIKKKKIRGDSIKNVLSVLREEEKEEDVSD